MDHIEECGMTEMPAAMPAPEMDKGNPVTVNVSMNASGKEHVADLLDMMKNAGLGGAEPVGAKMLSPRMDMERLSGIMGEPADGLDDREMDLPAIADLDGGEDESYAAEMDDIDTDEAYSAGDENAEGMVSNCCSAPVQDERDGTGRCSACGEGCEAVAEEAETEDMSSEGTYTVKVKGKNMDSQNELARLAGLPTNEVDDEVEVAEGGMKDQLIQAMEKIAADDSGELLHKAMRGAMGPDVQNYLQDMYDEVSIDHGLHPDDDHDDIEQRMWDEIEQDYGMGEGYANEPDAQYGDMSDAIPDGNDLNRKKKAYAATQDGDNPMAVENIKAALYAALTEKKKTMVKVD